MWLRIENFNMYYGVSPKNLIFRGEGGHKKLVYIGGIASKREVWTFCKFMEGYVKKRGGCF